MQLKRFSSLSGRRRRRKNVKHLLENAQLLTADKRSHLLIIVAFSAHLIIILLSYYLIRSPSYCYLIILLSYSPPVLLRKIQIILQSLDSRDQSIGERSFDSLSGRRRRIQVPPLQENAHLPTAENLREVITSEKQPFVLFFFNSAFSIQGIFHCISRIREVAFCPFQLDPASCKQSTAIFSCWAVVEISMFCICCVLYFYLVS